MLTRCPACTTTFRVTPEQLKARAGRVRCGRCDARFNALESLQEDTPPTTLELVASPSTIPSPPDISVGAGHFDEATAEPSCSQAISEVAAAPPTVTFTATPAPMASEAWAEPEIEPVPAPTAESGSAHTDSLSNTALKQTLTHFLLGVADTQPLPPIVAEELPPDVTPQTPDAPTTHDAPVPEVEVNGPVTEARLAAFPLHDAEADAIEDGPRIVDTPADTPVHADRAPAVGQVAADPDLTNQQDASTAFIASKVPEADTHADIQVVPETDIPEPATIDPPEYLPEPASPDRPGQLATFGEWQGDEETAPRRWPWVIGTLLAFVGLVAQAALHYRVELAVLQPQFKPTLIQACKYAGCSVNLPRKAEFLGIESSDLHPDPDLPGHLQLSATLRNRAPFAQEFPHLEVTLNDVADHALIVKDLKPEEYLPANIRPGAGFGINAEIAINLTLDVGDVPAAGYRLYLFYP